MVGVATFLLLVTLLFGVKCRDFSISLPQHVNIWSGSCVTIPCSFDIESKYDNDLNENCRSYWLFDPDDMTPRLREANPVTEDLTKKNCTTTLYNMQTNYSNTYYFRLACDNKLKWIFRRTGVKMEVTDDPPPPTLTPFPLKVNEGTSVSLTCSAPAPCLTHPPTLTWTPKLGESQETLQENQDKTKTQTSVLIFTASRLHHGQIISCTAVYKKQDGSSEASVTSNLTADISGPPQILPSSDCTKTPSQVNCSCQTVGNPSPTLRWYLDGQPVNQSSKLTVITESLTNTSLRSIITVNQPQDTDLTLLCHSFNSVGSASQQFSLSAQKRDGIPLPVFITTVVASLVLICVLLFFIRFQRNQLKSQLKGEIRDGTEVPNTTEDIYVNTHELRQTGVAFSSTLK